MFSFFFLISCRAHSRDAGSENSLLLTMLLSCGRFRCVRPSSRLWTRPKQRLFSSQKESLNEKHRKVAYFATALAVAVFGVSYASVPLYKVFCSMTGFGGTTQRVDEKKAATVKPVMKNTIFLNTNHDIYTTS